MSELTREQFVQQLIQQIHGQFPLVRIARAPQSFSVVVNGQTASLENIYRLTALKPEDLHRNVERWIVEMLRVSEGHPDHASGFEELKDRILPVVLPQPPADVDPATMVYQPFVADLVVAYAVDQQRTIEYIPRARFVDWKLSLDELHEVAIKNLVARSETLPAHAAPDESGKISLIVFQIMDGYDASRILLPSLHERLREYLGSPFAAAIPNRDILLCFRGDEETVGRYREQIAADYHSMPHQITEKLLLVTPDGVAPLE